MAFGILHGSENAIVCLHPEWWIFWYLKEQIQNDILSFTSSKQDKSKEIHEIFMPLFTSTS